MDFSNFKTIAIDGQEVKQLAINGDVVWVKPSETVPASISLSVDNPVIMTGETATIQALVLDADGNPCHNATVSFSCDIPNSSEYQTITNNLGIASFQWDSQGYGTTSITATVNSLSDSVTIEDYLFEDTMTSNSSKWNIPSTVTATYSENGMYMTASSYSTIESVMVFDKQPFVLETTINGFNGTNQPLMGIVLDSNNVFLTYSNNQWNHTNGNYFTAETIQNGDTIRLNYLGDNSWKIELQRGDTTYEIKQFTSNYSPSTFKIKFDTSTNRNQTIKNVRLKKLV